MLASRRCGIGFTLGPSRDPEQRKHPLTPDPVPKPSRPLILAATLVVGA
jgi:hypothetical protein